jgi:hypothetical protein
MIDALELRANGALNEIAFHDERHRAPDHIAAGSCASVTLSGRDSSWGEFLSRADVALLHAWTGALLADDWASALTTTPANTSSA